MLTVKFTDESKYIQHGGYDQEDILKITGMGSIKMITGPEGYKVRETETILGWRYNPKKDRFELFWHRRKNGVRSTQKITTLRRNQQFTVDMTVASASGPIPILPYFGGTSPEPKNGKSTKIFLKNNKQ